jgi:hypothetical protein
VSGPAFHGDRFGPGDLPARLRRIRLAAHHPVGQRRAVRHHRPRPLVAALGVVDPTRHLPRIDPTRPSRTERATRADAPHVEGGDHHKPPSGNLQAQQTRFNRFRAEYNDERPHEALDQETPASLYTVSPRALPRTLAPMAYPGHFEVRLVSRNSGIRWKKHWVCVTHTLAGEYVGLEEVDSGLWDVYFGPVKLGRMDERLLRIEDHKSRTVRRSSPPAGGPADAM